MAYSERSHEAPVTYQYASHRACVRTNAGALAPGVHRTVIPKHYRLWEGPRQLVPFRVDDFVPGHVLIVDDVNNEQQYRLPFAVDLSAAHPDIQDGGGFSCFITAPNKIVIADALDGTCKLVDSTSTVSSYPVKLFFHRYSVDAWVVRAM